MPKMFFFYNYFYRNDDSGYDHCHRFDPYVFKYSFSWAIIIWLSVTSIHCFTVVASFNSGLETRFHEKKNWNNPVVQVKTLDRTCRTFIITKPQKCTQTILTLAIHNKWVLSQTWSNIYSVRDVFIAGALCARTFVPLLHINIYKCTN